MSEQVLLPSKAYRGLPPLPVDGEALARFTIEMAVRLHELEQRFVTPRQHPRILFGESRGASRRPR
jgi:hypothetical protein